MGLPWFITPLNKIENVDSSLEKSIKHYVCCDIVFYFQKYLSILCFFFMKDSKIYASNIAFIIFSLDNRLQVYTHEFRNGSMEMI